MEALSNRQDQCGLMPKYTKNVGYSKSCNSGALRNALASMAVQAHINMCGTHT